MSEVRFQEAALNRHPLQSRDVSQMRNGNDENVTGRTVPPRHLCAHSAEIVRPLALMNGVQIRLRTLEHSYLGGSTYPFDNTTAHHVGTTPHGARPRRERSTRSRGPPGMEEGSDRGHITLDMLAQGF